MQICPYNFSRISWNLHFKSRKCFNSSEYWGAYYSVEICDDYFKSKINQGLYLSLNWHSEIKLAIKDNFAFSQQIIRCTLSLITRDIGVSWHRGSYNEFPRRTSESIKSIENPNLRASVPNQIIVFFLKRIFGTKF